MAQAIEKKLKNLVKMKLLRVSDIAKEADVSRPTVYKWLKSDDVKDEKRQAILNSYSHFVVLTQNFDNLSEFTPVNGEESNSNAVQPYKDHPFDSENKSSIDLNEDPNGHRRLPTEDRLTALLKASKRLKQLVADEVEHQRCAPGCHVQYSRQLRDLGFDVKAINVSVEELTG